MNKRQRKKRYKKFEERTRFVTAHIIFSGRRNGKHLLAQRINKAYLSKKYKPFKELKKELRDLYISYDLSNGKDYSVKTSIMRYKDKLRALGVEVIS